MFSVSDYDVSPFQCFKQVLIFICSIAQISPLNAVDAEVLNELSSEP
jgi:hypothetical protein